MLNEKVKKHRASKKDKGKNFQLNIINVYALLHVDTNIKCVLLNNFRGKFSTDFDGCY